MSIRVGKYDYKNKVQPTTLNYVNVLIHTTGELSPYVMKDKNGVIMENYWQFSKVWKEVYKIKSTISRFDQSIRWEHPNEVHFNNTLTDDYWLWREKGFTHDKWVRYPNSYKHHKEAIGSVIGTPDHYKMVDYIEARKLIYFSKYKEIALETNLFKKLKKMLEDGVHIQINEVDGPSYVDSYPYDLVVDDSLLMSTEILQALINNPIKPFGHGYALAACLLGVDLI